MGGEKLKKTGIYIGVTLTIYLVIRYLLPLVTPFVIAGVFAVMFQPILRFLQKWLRINRGIGTFLVMIAFTAAAGGALWWLAGILIGQIQNVIENYESYYQYINERLCTVCSCIDEGFRLTDGTALRYLDDGLVSMAGAVNEKLMPAIMGSSFVVVKWVILICGVVVIFFMAVFFLSRDYEKMKAYFANCIFAEEIAVVGKGLGYVFAVYLKTQLIIMGITTVICAGGLLLMKNPYWLLIGVALGIADALPVLGTGTFLIPWAAVTAVGGNYMQAFLLLGIYFVCYIIREYLEPKLMGKRLGIHPLFMLAAVYAGIILFGVTGVITGPIALLLIKEIISYYSCKSSDK